MNHSMLNVMNSMPSIKTYINANAILIHIFLLIHQSIIL